jgi:quinoprotein dehydrogenase-associated probable ABC transporter substrate-binding protein
VCIVGGLTTAYAQEARAEYLPADTLAVCQDPNNLPFSNSKGEGFENKIAELFAKKLGWKLKYYSFPQRLGFLRNTLKFSLPGEGFRCDLVMGVPFGYDQVATTPPYFRSMYTLVLIDHGNTAGVRTVNQFLALPADTLRSLRIGIFDRSPAAPWLIKHNLINQAIPYHTLNPDPDHYPGDIIERDLVRGKLDAAIVWGPLAGYLVKHITEKSLVMVPLDSTPAAPLDFSIAMGVRPEDTNWRLKVEQLLTENYHDIQVILKDYNVPLLDEKK